MTQPKVNFRVSGRQTGKTIQSILQLVRDPKAVLVTATSARAIDLRQCYPVVSSRILPPVHSVLTGRKIQNVIVEDVDWILEQHLQHLGVAPIANVTFTMTGEAI